MKKLLKVSDYYYVVDDEAEIKEGNYFLDMYNKQESGIQQCTRTHADIVNTKDKGVLCNKIIATTNPSIPLPQITNASDDMVGKEVEVEIFKQEVSAIQCTTPNGHKYLETAWMFVAEIKPISKASEQELFNDSSNVTFTVAEVREITNKLFSQNLNNKGNFEGFWQYMKDNFRDRFESAELEVKNKQHVIDLNDWFNDRTVEEKAADYAQIKGSAIYDKRNLIKMEDLAAAYKAGFEHALTTKTE